ncbi:mechanosensitive ion channel family protein [Jannaschia pohangensis]|uniref:Small-conductance mechanosensitive channel n=1 Tax=Jannaschia pohangensis TaxID=390807 RepID=A0A1I3SAN2_9RHOB|nr:mechanosensitive ion channel family protein [Jannaschia pohangensis]SFJ55755.1 Small-conductance mechanosensitive channel [Jannaschia pohangensis]
MTRILLRLFLTLALLFPLPLAAQDAAQPSGTISTTQDAGGDRAIQRRIEAIIGELDGYDDVTVTVNEGIVTFEGEVLDAETIPRLDVLAARVEDVVAIENRVIESTDVRQRLNPVAERFRTRATQFINYLPLLAVAVMAGVLVMFLGVIIARWERPWRRLAPNPFIADIYRTILRLVFVVAGVVVALDILNATALLSTLLGAAGIVGLAVGFAVRDTVENFIASVMLSLRQPFRPNDVVDIEGSTGSVIRLTSRATILLDPDGNHVRLPNSFVFKAKIINFTRNDERRFGFVLGIDPNDDLTEAKRIGLETLTALDFVLSEPAPQVWVAESGDSTVTMEFYGWVNQRTTAFAQARGEALRLVMAALTRAGIGLPEPSYRLNLVGGGLPVLDLPDQKGRSGEITVTEAEPAPPPPAEVAPPVAEDVAADQTIAKMVDAERRAEGEDDLLNTTAPRE